MTPAERFEAKRERGEGGCLDWTAGRDSHGYGVFWIGGRQRGAHVVAYELAHGPVPDGRQVDHLCHTRAFEAGECDGGKFCPHRRCVDVEHLEAVVPATNWARGNNPTGRRRRSGRCVNGHEVSTSGPCRPCLNAANRRWAARRAVASA